MEKKLKGGVSMSFVELLKAYMEVGFLGICAIVIIIILYKVLSNTQKEGTMKSNFIKNNTSNLESKLDSMISLIQKQNQELIEYQTKNTDLLIKSIITGVTTHTPSAEEDAELTNNAR